MPVPSDVLWCVGITNPNNNVFEIVGSKDNAASVAVLAKSNGYVMFEITYPAA